MSDLVFNVAKGKAAYYATLPAANDALIAVPIETTGIESDAILRDYDTLAAILAAANNEQSTMGRKTLASVAGTVDDTNDRVDVDAADVTWVAATGNAVSKLVICYDPDTTGGSDSDLIPLVALDMVVTPAGGDITFQFNAAGFYRAS
jgi:hypothetical protein